MSFFAKFLTGSLVGGGLTLYFQNDIRRTTESLTTDLQHLSDTLVRAVPVAQPSVAPPVAQGPVIPQRLPFTEELKARWNEQLGSLVHSAQTTDWSAVAGKAYSSLRSTLAGAADSAAPATVGAGAGAGAGALVGGAQPGPSTPETRYGAGMPAERENKGPRATAPLDKAAEEKPLAVREGKRWV